MVAVTTYLGDRRFVTEEVVLVFADFLRNHNTSNDLGDYEENRKNATKLIHMDHKSGMFLERIEAPKVKIVSTLLGSSYHSELYRLEIWYQK